MEETLTRQIKVYCPQHQSVFEVAASPKIVCQIREHALSGNFPNSEFWEYCCDCQTFFPSDLEVGGKAKSVCRQCERQTSSRSLCGECKVVTFDSGEDTKGKIFNVNSETFVISPSCPGCLKDLSAAKKNLHKCTEIEAIISTSLETCPFCKKETVKAKAKPAGPQCPECKTRNQPDSVFCDNCGADLRSGAGISKRKASKTKASPAAVACSNCGASNPYDSVFCANCGFLFKSEKAKSEPLPTMPAIPQSAVATQELTKGAVPAVKSPATAKPGGAKGCGIAIGVLLGFIFLIAIISAIVSNQNRTGSFLTPTPTTRSSTATPYPVNTGNSTSSASTNYYKGKIGKADVTMSLTRDGTRLTGTASTANHTDYLYGTIESDGTFALDGKEDDSEITGYYNGQITSNGSVNGKWTDLNGGRATSFSLTLSK